jgi:hypothetical protein
MRCGVVTKERKRADIEPSPKEQILAKYANVELCQNKTCFPLSTTTTTGHYDDGSSPEPSGNELSIPRHVAPQRYDSLKLFCYFLLIVLIAWYFFEDISWTKILRKILRPHLKAYIPGPINSLLVFV